MLNEYYAKTFKTKYICFYFFMYILYTSVFLLLIMFFSCISISSLSYIQRFLSRRKLVKTLLHTQLKQTNLKNGRYISTEIPKEGFNDTVFQHFLDELKHCNSDMQMDWQLLVSVFLCLYSIYLFVMLPFCFISFVILQYFSLLLQD